MFKSHNIPDAFKEVEKLLLKYQFRKSDEIHSLLKSVLELAVNVVFPKWRTACKFNWYNVMQNYLNS